MASTPAPRALRWTDLPIVLILICAAGLPLRHILANNGGAFASPEMLPLAALTGGVAVGVMTGVFAYYGRGETLRRVLRESAIIAAVSAVLLALWLGLS
jgi:hypothetical protein